MKKTSRKSCYGSFIFSSSLGERVWLSANEQDTGNIHHIVSRGIRCIYIWCNCPENFFRSNVSFFFLYQLFTLRACLQQNIIVTARYTICVYISAGDFRSPPAYNERKHDRKRVGQNSGRLRMCLFDQRTFVFLQNDTCVFYAWMSRIPPQILYTYSRIHRRRRV